MTAATPTLTPTLTPTGVRGLDGALYGGLPAGKNTLIVGTPGSGKTMLGLQFLLHGVLQFDEPALMISFEESPEGLRKAAERLGLPGAADAAARRFHFLDGRPILDAVAGGAFDLGGLTAIIADEVRRSSIRRVVFDGLDALFANYGNGEVTAREFRRIVEMTEAENLTSLVCLKPGRGSDELPLRFDLLEYSADAVIRLGYRITEGLLQRLVRIVKIRNAGFAAGEHPFIIDDRGIEVSFSPAIKGEPPATRERVSCGIPELDHMLAGGFIRGSTTLISGLPGTAKSTIGSSFLEAGLKRGERCLLVAMDESAGQLIANMCSVGINLEQHLASDMLSTLSLSAGSVIADELYFAIERAVTATSPTLLVIDPISAVEKAGGRDIARGVVERLTSLVRSRGMVAVFTAVTNSQLGELECAVGDVSAIADSWIHLSFAIQGGERNRTLTIIKSRGTAHSNQVREMVLSESGVTLQDVDLIHGDFLLGTARLEREQDLKRRSDAHDLNVRNIRRALDERRELAISHLRDAERELSEVDERMSAGIEESATLEAGALQDRSEVLLLREARGQ